MTILETKNLKKYYGKGDTQVKALDGVNLSVEDGEFVAIVGTSGSGKSTLLHMLGGLDRPTSGSVTVDGKNIFSLKDEALTIFRRRKIGFVFQSFNLVPVLTVRENIVLPIQLDGGKVDERYVGEVVTALGLEKKLNSLPGQLLYCALIGYIHYEAPVEEQNFSTLIEFINAMEVREDDEEFKNPVDLMFDALEAEKPNHFAVRQYKKYKLAAGDICSK